MNDGMAYCGLTCQTCPIYLATFEENKEEQARMREEIVRLSLEQYGLKFTFEDITDCDGCRAETGRLFSACKDCPIRNCARAKRLENCAYCPDYACANLAQFFHTDPSCKERLDEIRISAVKKMPMGEGR